jgi:UDP-N-acetyl-D-glucosamine dehydrogenase
VAWNRETVASFDVVLISTAHRAVNYEELAEWAQCIVDTRNAMVNIKVDAGKVWKA